MLIRNSVNICLIRVVTLFKSVKFETMAKWSEEFLTEFVELCWKVKSEAYSDRVRKDANLDAVVKKKLIVSL